MNKFFYYINSIGFTIFFWLTARNKLEVRYNCQYVCGKLRYQRIEFNNLVELIKFIHNPGYLIVYRSSVHGMISQLTSIENQLFYKNKRMLKWQLICYEQKHNLSGAPLICDLKQVTNPVIGKHYLIWKILLVSSIEENKSIWELFDTVNNIIGIKLSFPLINNPKQYVKSEFELIIKVLINKNFIKLNDDVIHIVNKIDWFKDYYQKLNYLSTQKKLFF